MTECTRITHDEFTDYAAGELPDADAAALEEHLFSCAECGARAAAFEGLVGAIRPAVESGQVSGFVTDAVLNRMARQGLRMRTYALSPGDRVPCGVWDGDEVMVLRLRGDFGHASEFTLSRRVGGSEVSRATVSLAPGPRPELIHILPAALVRELPAVELDVRLTAHEEGGERLVGAYTLVHGGAFHRD